MVTQTFIEEKKGNYFSDFLLNKLEESVGRCEIFSDVLSICTGRARIKSGSSGQILLEVDSDISIEADMFRPVKSPSDKSWGFHAEHFPMLVGLTDKGHRITCRFNAQRSYFNFPSRKFHAEVMNLEFTRKVNYGLHPFCNFTTFIKEDVEIFDLVTHITEYSFKSHKMVERGKRKKFEPGSRGLTRNKARIQTRRFNFDLEKGHDCIKAVVYQRRANQLPQEKDLLSLLSGLSFLSGIFINFVGYTQTTNHFEKYVIHPGTQRGDESIFYRPLPSIGGENSTDFDFWNRALTCWLENPHRVNLFGAMSVLLKTSTSYFDVKVQLLCSSLEGVCRAICENVSWPEAETTKEAVSSIKEHIKSLMSGGLSRPVGDRLMSLLKISEHPSAPSLIKETCIRLGFEASRSEIKAGIRPEM